ncbi:MAG TPA: TetR/AcrR family transcriptional regulator [Candidatus Limnocylindria bacterium]|jgi:AcrR family transcriptional regulator|nr:TetR/AcrR family transcriptional regulator [Candidatus Limnocylindria bacterium]
MAYEVVKTIAGRSYRYQVESIRDPETGKRRNHWTYLGRVEGAQPRAAAPKRRTDGRERLLDALERLLESRDFAALTADAIAGEAGLAHGTFYRHFKDKRAALLAAMDRIRERRGPVFAALGADVATREEARAGLRRLVEATMRSPAEHPALLRAYFGLALRDEEFVRDRRERKARAVRKLGTHLAELRAQGFATLRDPGATAAALFAMLDGCHREALVEGDPPDEARIDGVVEVFERAVFGELARREDP